jgi:hypothetical protein
MTTAVATITPSLSLRDTRALDVRSLLQAGDGCKRIGRHANTLLRAMERPVSVR